MIVLATADISTIPLPSGFEPLVGEQGQDEHHVVAGSGAARLRICLRPLPPGSVESLIILRDRSAPERLSAALHFERMAGNRPHGSDRAPGPTDYRRGRLIQLLAICDGLVAGAGTRDLAFALVFPHHRPLAGATWKGSGERRHTLRLIAEARRQVATGYRALLRHK